MEVAARHGERDTVQGKRGSERYHFGAHLDLRLESDEPGAVRRAVMHNVSSGGLGFWAAERLEPNTRVWIREAAEPGEPDSPWVEARVTHCTLGIRGYLVGSKFVSDAAGAAGPDGGGVNGAAPDGAAAAGIGRTGHRPSLRVACARSAALGGALGAALGLLAFRYAAMHVGFQWQMTATAVVSLAFGALGAWLALGSTIDFLGSLRRSIRAVDGSSDPTDSPPDAPFSELTELHDAVMSLRRRWRSREDHERAQRQKLEELNLVKTNILNMVSHDLRTPLTSIRLYADMLAEGLGELQRDDQQRFLEIITGECQRLARLVDDLLEAQRLEAGRVSWNMQPQEVAHFIRACANVMAPMAAAKSIALTVDCPDELPTIQADADKLSQVLSNLVSNAIKYTPAGGRVHVSARDSTNEVMLCVSDNGPGIPREKWDFIFDRFAQVTASFASEIGGVGLGLYIVRQIVDHHGGRVWVDSEVGRGSSFYIALPVQQASAESQAKPAHGDGAAGRVLVCDADSELAARMAQSLRREGYDARCVYSGCRLLAQIVETQPDVVLTDLLMPDMDSQDLLFGLAELRTSHPFRLVAHTFIGDGLTLREQGVDVILTRPAYPEDLVQSVRVAIRGAAGAGQSVLLLCSDAFDPRKLVAALGAAGHAPIVAQSRAHAARIAEDYPVDAAVLSDDLLNEHGDLLAAVRRLQPRARLWVVSRAARRRDRRCAERLGANLITCEKGGEERVASELAARSPQPQGVAP